MANAHDLLMAQRAEMMGGTPLPYDAEVEWIGSDGKSYIDTGISIENFDSVSCVYKGSVAAANIFLPNSGSLSNIGVWYSGTFRLPVIDTGVNCASYVYEWHEYSIVDGNFKIDGITVYTFSPIYARDKMFIFSNSRGTFAGFCGGFRVINSQGVARIDIIPVRFTNENGVSEGAMYDRVSGQLFRNAGTGAFVIGPDKT